MLKYVKLKGDIRLKSITLTLIGEDTQEIVCACISDTCASVLLRTDNIYVQHYKMNVNM